MKKFLNKNLNRAVNIIENPELLKTINKKIDRGFISNLLVLKKKLGVIPNTIFDIGAATGEWTKAARFTFPNAQIYSFEPIIESYKTLERLKENDSAFFPYNFALSHENSQADFYLNEFSFSSSLLKMTDSHETLFPFTKKKKRITIECRRLDSFKEINIISPSLLKMDVQGAELLVLNGCGKIINQIDAIELEVSFERFYESQAIYSELFNFMKINGFNSFLQLNPHFYKNKILWCDIFFTK